MQNYKDLNNKLHVLDLDIFDYLLPQGCVKISDEEAFELSNPPKTTAQINAENNALIYQKLDELDAKSIRALREADTQRLATLNATAHDLRSGLIR